MRLLTFGEPAREGQRRDNKEGADNEHSKQKNAVQPSEHAKFVSLFPSSELIDSGFWAQLVQHTHTLAAGMPRTI